jgi:hypothetical protein
MTEEELAAIAGRRADYEVSLDDVDALYAEVERLREQLAEKTATAEAWLAEANRLSGVAIAAFDKGAASTDQVIITLNAALSDRERKVAELEATIREGELRLEKRIDELTKERDEATARLEGSRQFIDDEDTRSRAQIAELTAQIERERRQSAVGYQLIAGAHFDWLTRVEEAIHIFEAEDVTDWQRGYRACATQVAAAITPRSLERRGQVPTDPASSFERQAQLDADLADINRRGLVIDASDVPELLGGQP